MIVQQPRRALSPLPTMIKAPFSPSKLKSPGPLRAAVSIVIDSLQPARISCVYLLCVGPAADAAIAIVIVLSSAENRHEAVVRGRGIVYGKEREIAT